MICLFVHLSKVDPQPGPKKAPPRDKVKNASAIATQTKQGETLCKNESDTENIHAEEDWTRARRKNKKGHRSSVDIKVAYFPDANFGRGVVHERLLASPEFR